MASLALMVCIFFLLAILLGPLSLICGYFDFYYLTLGLGAFAITSGLFWSVISPFPISIAGVVGAICGLIAINRIIN